MRKLFALYTFYPYAGRLTRLRRDYAHQCAQSRRSHGCTYLQTRQWPYGLSH